MEEEQQLRQDLDELRHLENIAKRPRVLSLLASEIRNLDAELSRVAVAGQSVSVSTEKVPTNAGSVNRSYVTLGTFSWDQDNDKLKEEEIRKEQHEQHFQSLAQKNAPDIYISIEGAEQEKVETVFKSSSIDIKFHEVHGKNYRFVIPKLNKEIVPEKCKILVKPSRVIATLIKDSKGNWLDLYAKEDKFKPSLDKGNDPMAGIMDLMKNMYEEGDDDMKRTIAKAWTDARNGKTADPLKIFR